MVDIPEKHRTTTRPTLKKAAVIQDPNNKPIQKDFVILYPIAHDTMSSIEPKHLSAPVKRKITSVRAIIPPKT